AMSLIGPPAASGEKKSRSGGASTSRARSSTNGKFCLARLISPRLVATIWSRMVGTDLDVVHAFRSALEPLHEGREGHAVKQLALFRGDFLPGPLQDPRRGRVPRSIRRRMAKLRIDNRHHIQQRDLLRLTGQVVAAGGSANAMHQPCAFELQQNLHEKSRGNTVGLGNVANSHRF